MLTPPRVAFVGFAVTACLALSACGAPVSVSPPQTDDATKQTCLNASRQLPETVLDQARRPTDPVSVLTASWGDPPIVWTCGTPTPSGLTPTSQVIEVNGVSWFPEEYTGGYVFTTVNREVNMSVSVPSSYAPEVSALADLSGNVTLNNPKQKGKLVIED